MATKTKVIGMDYVGLIQSEGKIPLKLRAFRSYMNISGTLFPKKTARYAMNIFFTPKKRPLSRSAGDLFSDQYSSWFDIDGKKFKYWQWGQGPNILLVHGWGSNGSQMRSFVQPLLDSGYSVTTFDMFAHGQSEGQQTNLIEIGDSIVKLAKEIGDIKGIITHSFGGPATLVALNNGLTTEKLMLISCPFDFENSIVRAFNQILNLPQKSIDYMKQYIVDFVKVDPADYMPKRLAEKISVPTLVLHDRDDDVIPFSDAIATQSKIKNSNLIGTEGLGHRKILHNEEAITQVLKFLN